MIRPVELAEGAIHTLSIRLRMLALKGIDCTLKGFACVLSEIHRV